MVIEKKSLILLGLFFGMYLIAGVSASLYLSPLDSTYNIGDSVDLNITIDPIVDGPFKLKLICDGKGVDVFSGPAIENLVLPLNELWINDLKGSCYFLAEYGGDQKRTEPNFVISDKLNIVLETDSFFAKPDETIIVKGTVTKVNGNLEEGEVEILTPFKGVSTTEIVNNTNSSTGNVTNTTVSSETVIGNDSNFGKFYGKVSNGKFSVSLRLPSNVPSGNYALVVNAYDQTLSGKRLNQGSATGSLKVPQILRGIDIALNNQNFNPGDNVSIKPTLVDQVAQPIADSSFVLIEDSSGNKVYEQVISSGETGLFEIPTDFSSGHYSIKVSSGDKKVNKNFFVNEMAKIFFEIRNDTLFVKNIGNIRYSKEIKVDINGKPFIKQIDLEVGEQKELYLYGEDGIYNVSASDGNSSINKDNVLLTGHAIDVKDFRNVGLNLFSNPLLWIFLILIVVVAIAIITNKVVKKRSVARPRDYYGKPAHLKLDGVMKKEQKEEKPQPNVRVLKQNPFIPVVAPTIAIQGLVTKGHRNNAVVIALKIKNKINPFAKEFVQKAVNSVYTRKGAVYESGEYVIAIFSPLSTKSFKNEVDASKVAESICNSLLDYNKKFKEPIEFGIGVNSGDIINEIKDGKLLFTALGSTLLFSKKLAELSKDDVLLSESVYHKEMSEIKADRKSFGEVVAFKVKKIVDYEKNKKFIDDFLKRAEKDSSGVKYVKSDGYLSRNRVGSGVPGASSLIRDSGKVSENSNSGSSGNVNHSPRTSSDTDYVDFR